MIYMLLFLSHLFEMMDVKAEQCWQEHIGSRQGERYGIALDFLRVVHIAL